MKVKEMVCNSEVPVILPFVHNDGEEATEVFREGDRVLLGLPPKAGLVLCERVDMGVVGSLRAKDVSRKFEEASDV